ncbi:MAG: glycosyltransferase [Bacteroidales bacterium]|nr:glycosyltransferase [Bacteroidales bacterium]
MLSICISIYNWEVTTLVRDLLAQAYALNVPFEVVLLDDASEESFQQLNAPLSTLPYVTYVKNEVNGGRSAARNRLANLARYPYLLFLDCDTSVTHSDFLKNYLAQLPAKVVSGGYAYGLDKPLKENRLRWVYGLNREVVAAEVRNLNPNYSFSTFNFLISKDIFQKISFDETLSQYGHEDTLFGIELLENEIVVKHIDNPLRHDVVISSEKFLKQTESAIDNLIIVLQKVKNKEAFIQNVSLLRTYFSLKKWHLLSFYRLFYTLFSRLLKRNLTSANPSIFLFDLYKLGYLSKKNENEISSILV